MFITTQTIFNLISYDMAQDNIFGVLSNYNITDNLPAILDAIRWKETGGEKNPLKAIGSSGEIGAYQLNPEHFHDFGFDVQKNITNKQAQGYFQSRKIASDLLEGMKKYRNYDLAQMLAGYNWGSGKVDKWIKSGGKFEDLPDQTQDYLTKVANKLQEGYVDPLRASMMPQPKPQTMLASATQGINQNYDNDLGQVDITYRGDAQLQNNQNPSFWSQLNPIQAAHAAPPNITNTKIGNNNMNVSNTDLIQERMLHEAVRDGRTKVSDDGYIINEAGEVSGFEFDPNYFGTDNPITVNEDINAGLLSREAYFNQPKAALDAMNQNATSDSGGFVNQAINNRMPGNLTQPSKWSPSVGRNASGQIINNPFGISSANAAQPPNNNNNNQNQSSQSQPNPNMTRTNTALSSPANSMMISDGEMLMRMAGAGMSNLGKGSSAALGSALAKYGEINDTNRLTALEIAKYEAENKVELPQFVSGYTQTVFNTLDDIDKIFEEDWFTSGLGGRIAQYIPGSGGYDLQRKFDTLRSAIGFDKLQDMRDKSPTGGALGQVSERELTQLNAALGSLDIGQSGDQLRQNVADVRRHYMNTVKALKAEYDAAGAPFPIDINNLGRSGNTGSGQIQWNNNQATINGVIVKKANP